MDYFLCDDILLNILSRLHHTSINSLSLTSKEIRRLVMSINGTNRYWSYRIESEFNLIVPLKSSIKWEKVYKLLNSRSLSYLMYSYDPDVVDFAILNGQDPSADDNYALIVAAERGYLATVNRLLKDPRVNPGDFNNAAIRSAAWRGHANVVKRLLEDSRVDPSAASNFALRTAIERNHEEVVKLLRKLHKRKSATLINYNENHCGCILFG